MDVVLLLQALFTSQGFNFPLLVAFLQMSVICPVCYAVARPRVDVELAKLVSPLALVNVLNVVCGLISAPPHRRRCLCLSHSNPLVCFF